MDVSSLYGSRIEECKEEPNDWRVSYQSYPKDP